MPRALKQARLREMGVDLTLVQRFDHAFAAIEAEAFPGHLQAHLPTLKALYVGENFRFGKKRRGDVALLIEACRTLGIRVFSAERIRENGEPISSTRIRAELEAGRIEQASALLGYTYRSLGDITPGRQLGRTIGFPTVNLPWEPELPPRFGVYAVRARIEGKGEPWLPGVANYGLRPTVEESAPAPRLEVHLLEPVDWQPPQQVEVLWGRFLRPETKFDGLDALKAQIAQDRDSAAVWWSGQAEAR